MSWRITPTGGALGLLDQYGEAAAAYSLRNLSLYYTGNVVRVRRISDNTEQDFTATQVTDGTLTTFCGAGNGFVRTWYDQSGNGRNAEQSTTANQPQIVSSGAVLTKGTKPCIAFATSKYFNLITASYTGFSLFSVFDPRILSSPDSFNIFIGHGTGTLGTGVRPTLKLYDSGGVFNASAANSTIALNQQCLLTVTTGTSPVFLHKNSSLLSTVTGAIASKTAYRIGKVGDLSITDDSCGIAEIVFYFSDQAANRVAIESNINAHYAIY